MPVVLGNLKLFTVDELSESLKTTKVIIRRYMHEGRITGQKIAGRWYVSEESLSKFFTTQKLKTLKQG